MGGTVYHEFLHRSGGGWLVQLDRQFLQPCSVRTAQTFEVWYPVKSRRGKVV